MTTNDTTIRNAEAVREVLKQACYRRGAGVLVTPYAKFECSFIWLDQEEVHLTAAITKEDVDFALKSPDLKIRFPHGHTVLSAPTRLVGIGLVQGRKTLRMSLPATLEPNDYRESYRVERVGRVMVTFSSRKYKLLSGKLLNISPTGARILAVQELEDGDIRIDDTVHVTIPLTSEINIVNKARVRNLKDQSLGLEFRPKLDGRVLEDLWRWVHQKQAETVRMAGEKDAEGAAGSELEEFLVPMGNEPIIALIGGTPELAQMLQPMLTGLPPLHRFAANVQTMKALAFMPNSLVLYYMGSNDPTVRKRARLLLEPLHGKVPVMLVGTTLDKTALQEMAAEMRAISIYSIQPTGNILFPRVVAGILRMQQSGA
jgi:hypothetical protein